MPSCPSAIFNLCAWKECKVGQSVTSLRMTAVDEAEQIAAADDDARYLSAYAHVFVSSKASIY